MSESEVFERTCAELEQATSFDSLSARGTVRLALKSAGFEPRKVTSVEMVVVVKRVLPAELKARGVRNADEVCATIADRIADLVTASPQSQSPVEEVFRRLGGR